MPAYRRKRSSKRRINGSGKAPIKNLITLYLVLMVLTTGALIMWTGHVKTNGPAIAASTQDGENTTAFERVKSQVAKFFGIDNNKDNSLAVQSNNLNEQAEDQKSESIFKKAVNGIISVITNVMNGIKLDDPTTFFKSEMPIISGNDKNKVSLASNVQAGISDLQTVPLDGAIMVNTQAQYPENLDSLSEKAPTIIETEPKPEEKIEIVPKEEEIKIEPEKAETKAPALESNTVLKRGMGEPQIAIVHTHNSEAYSASQGSDYLWGKTDGVVSIGWTLANGLYETYNISSVQSTQIHDYPDWTKSYANSLVTMQDLVKKYSSLKMVLDIHRDAAISSIARTVTINGVKAARILIVVTNNDSGLAHPNWKKNYSLALKLNEKLNELYPGLSRGVTIKSNSRLNQHVHEGALIIEMGSTLNTKAEAEASAKMLAHAISEMF